MAEKKRRIHHLAKDLNVKSKSIIEKCEAEGIPIKNHMHVVSAGLEATIREWFSEGAHTTTFEEAGRVDLKSVRVKRKKTTKKKAVAAKAPPEADKTAGEAADKPDRSATAAPTEEVAAEAAPAAAPTAEPVVEVVTAPMPAETPPAPATESTEPPAAAAEAPSEAPATEPVP
ncbi:MAG: translation initiation factor IF-2 N-terminal domain-containing protein, partial [Phycisphaerae bacterium]